MHVSNYALWLIVLSITQINRSAAFPIYRQSEILETDDYYDYEGMLQYLEAMSYSHRDRMVLQDVGTTYEYRSLKSVTITNGDGRSGKKVIFVVAGAHAREWLTPAAALYVVDQLLRHPEEYEHLLKDYDWILMPLVNPDGYTYSRTTDRMWRNNRSPNGFDCFGTNINRNYEIGWQQGYPELKDPCHSHYSGKAPFSEAETRAVRDIMLDLVSSKRAVMYITLHSHHTCIYYPWVYKSSPTDNARKLEEVAKAGADAMNERAGPRFVYEQAGATDSFGGTSLDYAYAIGFPLAYALELSGERRGYKFDFWPPTSMLKELMEESWTGIRAMSEKAIEYYPLDESKSAASQTQSALSLENIIKILLLSSVLSIYF